MNRLIRLYENAALRLKLPFQYRKEYHGIEIHLAKKKYFFRNGRTPFNDGCSESIAENKYSFNRLLHHAGFPVPDVVAVSKRDCIDGKWVLPDITYPVVAKPFLNPAGGGLDVFCNIQDEQTLIAYLEKYKDKYEFINIEKFESGLNSYRVLVFFNKVIAVTFREPAHVVGDGKHTIRELVAIENAKRIQITTLPLGPLRIDEECQTKLKEMNLTANYILPINKKLSIRYTCNSGCGGTIKSLARTICKENAKLACRAAKLLDLNLVGFDVVCEDILRPIENSRGFFIEANCNPDITIHEAALEGVKVPVSTIFLRKIIYRHPITYLYNHVCKTLYLRALLVIILLFGLTKYRIF